MSASLNTCLTIFSTRIDEIRSILYTALTDKIHNSSIIRNRGSITVSVSYVLACAAIEVFTKNYIQALIYEINNSGITYNKLIPTLHSLVFSNEFSSLKDVKGTKMWKKRVEILTNLQKNQLVNIEDGNLLLDGRTIQPEHIELIWEIFNFQTPSFPHPRHKLALIDLAEGRNEVAHGETDPIRFGRNKNVGDTLKLLDLIDELFVHISVAGVEYVNSKCFKI